MPYDKNMLDTERVQEIKDRLADRYTASELAELLDIPVEEIIEEFWSRVLSRPEILEEVGATVIDEDKIEEEE